MVTELYLIKPMKKQNPELTIHLFQTLKKKDIEKEPKKG